MCQDHRFSDAKNHLSTKVYFGTEVAPQSTFPMYTINSPLPLPRFPWLRSNSRLSLLLQLLSLPRDLTRHALDRVGPGLVGFERSLIQPDAGDLCRADDEEAEIDGGETRIEISICVEC